MLKRSEIEIVGFDIDETLYPTNPEINGRIRTEIAKVMLAHDPGLGSLATARGKFEDLYTEIGSGRRVLERVGVPNSSLVMDDCIANADILDLINPDPRLADLLAKLGKKYMLGVVTSNPQRVAASKLERLGLPATTFKYGVFSDDENIRKTDGSAFRAYLGLFGANPIHHVYVGNSAKADIIPARAAGMQTIAVGSKIPEATVCVDAIYEIERLL